MHPYRLSIHKTVAGDRFQFGTDLPAQAMVTTADSLSFKGWVASNCGVIRGIELVMVNRRRRILQTSVQFVKSDDGLSRFRFNLGEQQELLKGDEFAVEVHAVVADRSHPLFTLTFVRDDCVKPAVFIVGSPRSGTTIIGNSLRSILNADEGFGESHLLPLANAVVDVVDEYHQASGASKLPGMMLHHVNKHLIGEQMLSVIKRHYSNLFEKGYILDKTPGGAMIRALPHVQRLWPNARIIMVKRRALENVSSRLKKFPDIDFKTHCTQWNNCMNSWDWVKGDLMHRIEVDQYDVLNNPGGTAEKIGQFLDLSETQLKELERRFSSDTPERSTQLRSSTAALSLETIAWNSDQKAYFLEHCAEKLHQWGYSLDESYYQLDNAA